MSSFSVRFSRPKHRLRPLTAAFIGITALQPAARAASTLPTGGTFTAGSGSISSSGGALTINQSSFRGIIDWSSFSIGKGGIVSFNNGAGATLNRVTGGAATAILGQLVASGSVYILNPQGVLIGRGATVHTGGDFLASALNLSNSAFLNHGSLVFTGSSTASVVNLGNLTSSGGSVYLIAYGVRNGGSINTPNGSTGLAAGSQVLIADTASDQRVFVEASGGDITNTGFINAAQAELKSNGGNIYALAGNHGSQIRATGTATKDGHVWLIADGGVASVSGTISAQNAGGAGGAIETSGAQVHTSAATITTGRGGSWLLDPDDLTIDGSLASTIETSLNNGTNVTEQTSAPTGGGNGDITVASDVAWSSGASLTLSAYRNISVNSGVTLSNTGAGSLTLRADNSSNGTGAATINGLVDFSASTGNVAVLYDPAGTASTKYTAPVTYGVSQIKTNSGWTAPTDNSVSSQSTAYMLVNNVTDLQNLNTNRAGTYALGSDVDASSVANFAPIATPSTFSGIFDGQGHTISNLTINDTTDNYVGLFGNSSGKIRNINLTNESVTGSAGYLGGLAGYSSGTVSNSHVAGTVMQEDTSHEDYFGGLLGWNQATVNNSWANVTVAASSSGVDYYAGGLIGVNFGPVSNSYATGSVTLSSSSGSSYFVAGGLAGYNQNTITTSYASGAVNVNAGGAAYETTGGGLVGENHAAISNSYATGPVNGGSNVYAGGLAGYSYGTISSSYATGSVTATTTHYGGGLIGDHVTGAVTSSYWDSQTTGQSGASGNAATISGATSRTTAQLQNGTLPAGFSSTNWIAIAGLYPLLTWQGKLIAGTVFNGSSPLASVTVDGLINGITVGGVTTNASGYYSFFAPNSAFSAGAGVLTYLLGGTPGNTFSDGDGAGAYTGMNIYAGTLTLLNRTNNTYSGMLNALGAALGSNSGSNFLFALNSGALGLNTGANLSLVSNTAFAIDQPVNAPSGNVQIQSQGDVAQSQPIAAAGLNLSGNGNFTLTNASNSVGILAANIGGRLNLTNSGPLTIGTVGNSASVSAGGTLLINTSGNLTISSGSTLTGSGSGDAVVLATGGRFLNLEGSDALNVSGGGGRWLVYSQNPANDTRGGLAYGFKQYDAVYGSTTPAQATGNGFLYTYAPVLTVGLTGTTAKTYDGTAAAVLTSANYDVTGVIDGDAVTLANTPASGTYSDPNAGSGKNVSASGISFANLSIANGSANIYGYQLGSTVSGNIGTINPATLTYTADSSSRSYGVANPAFTGTVTGFVSGETLASATTGAAAFTSSADGSSAAGSYAINGSGLTANYGNYVFTQAASNATALTVTAAIVVPPPPPPPPPTTPATPTVLTLIVNNATRLENQINPTFTATYNGPVISALDISALAASLTYQTAASSAPAGTYSIAASTATVLPGYTIQIVPGILTVIGNSPHAIPTQIVSNSLLLPNPLPAIPNFTGNSLQPGNAWAVFQIGISGTNDDFVPPSAGLQQAPWAQSSFFGGPNHTGTTYFAGAKP